MKDLLFSLSKLNCIGSVCEVSDTVYKILSEYAVTKKQNSQNVIGFLKGKADYTVMLDAHIDQIGFVVTNVDSKGFITVNTVGGIDLRSLPSRQVTVHGKQKITAVFCSVPPHLAKGDTEYTDITELKLDTALGKKAKDIVSMGDFVTFDGDCFNLSENIVTGKSFDNRAGVTCLLELAKRLSKKELPVNVAFCFSHGEELGLRGVRTAAYEIEPCEAIAVDVTFGNAPNISSDEGYALGSGAMIGVSPTLSKEVSDKLINTAKENNIPFNIEVMAEKTGTNADMIGVTKSGVKTGTLSIPIRNMHTSVETLDICDLSSVCDLLEKYILSGGVFNG